MEVGLIETFLTGRCFVCIIIDSILRQITTCTKMLLIRENLVRKCRLFKGKTEKISTGIFSANGNGLKNVFFLTAREQKNVHIGHVTQTEGWVGVCVYLRGKPRTHNLGWRLLLANVFG